MARLLYFAWLKSHIGTAEEEVTLPEQVSTVGELLAWLPSRGPGFAKALENPAAIRVAVNQEYAKASDPIGPGDEIALFPPVTGG